VVVVNLASGEKKEYPRIRRVAFNGEAATYVALHRAPAAAAGAPGAAPAGGGRGAAPGGTGAPAAPIGPAARTSSCATWRPARS
jgi:hypothetical protein